MAFVNICSVFRRRVGYEVSAEGTLRDPMLTPRCAILYSRSWASLLSYLHVIGEQRSAFLRGRVLNTLCWGLGGAVTITLIVSF